jgi:CelD/BcsL family acetyltransferase involved in cellulose biosynthesis
MEVDVIRDRAALAALEPVWNRLVDRSGADQPFSTHEWLTAWWDAFGAGAELYVLRATSGAETVALAPLMIHRVKRYGFTLRRLGFLYNPHTPRCDFIVARGCDDAYSALWEHMTRNRREWDFLELPQIAEGSGTAGALASLASRSGYRVGAWRSEDSPYITLSGTWEAYFKARDRKHRSNVRNRLNRLDRLGDLALEEVAAPEAVESALEEGLRMEAKAWKGRAGTAIESQPEVLRFYTQLARLAGGAGWLRLYFLKLGERRIAFDYSLRYKDRLYILKPGYDPTYAPYSPYNSLCCLKLQHAFASGLVEYDFLGISDRWKLDWTSERRAHSWFYAFRDAYPASVVHYLKFEAGPRLKTHPILRPVADLVARRAGTGGPS